MSNKKNKEKKNKNEKKGVKYKQKSIILNKK